MSFDREQYLKDRAHRRTLDFIQKEADVETYKRQAMERKHSNFKFEMGLLAVFGVLPMLTVVGLPFGIMTFVLYGIWKFLTRGYD